MPAHRLAPIALVLALAAPALAGCITEIPSATNAAAVRPSSLPSAGVVGNGTLPSDVNATIRDPALVENAPRWSRGDWWRFESVSGSTVVATFSFIVEDASPTLYRIATDNPEVAMWEDIFDIVVIGQIETDDLDARQHGFEVELLQWPLVNGTTWDTMLDGREMEAVLVGPDAKGMWTTTMLWNNRTYATIVYDPAVRMYRSFDFPLDGFGLRMLASGTDYEGPIASVQASKRLHEERRSPSAVESFFNVEQGASRVRVTVTGDTERFYSHHLYFIGPDNAHRQPIAARVCTAACDEFKEAWLDPIPGRWIAAGDFGASDGWIRLEVTEYRFILRDFASLATL